EASGKLVLTLAHRGFHLLADKIINTGLLNDGLVTRKEIEHSGFLLAPFFLRVRTISRVLFQGLVFNLSKHSESVATFCAVRQKEVRPIGRAFVDFCGNDMLEFSNVLERLAEQLLDS